MTTLDRNTKVLAALIAAMTFGAAFLLWLEPPAPGWSSSTLLMAESTSAVSEVRIECATDAAAVGQADCVVLPDGTCRWQPRGEQITLLVLADEGGLSDQQALTLLAVLGTLAERHGLDLKNVWLHPASDARLHPELPLAAHDLCRLLVRKGIIP